MRLLIKRAKICLRLHNALVIRLTWPVFFENEECVGVLKISLVEKTVISEKKNGLEILFLKTFLG